VAGGSTVTVRESYAQYFVIWLINEFRPKLGCRLDRGNVPVFEKNFLIQFDSKQIRLHVEAKLFIRWKQRL
jgi:hypothetical protein